MRFRNYLMLVGLVAVCSIGMVFVGCSDDDDSPTVPPGSSNQYYETVQAQVNSSLSSSVAQIEDALATILTEREEPGQEWEIDNVYDSIITALRGSLPVDSTQTPDSTHEWFVLYSTDLQSGVTTSSIDSLRWLLNSQFQTSSLEIDAFDFRRHYSTTAADTTVSYTNMMSVADVHFENVDSTTAIATGTATFDIASKFTSADSSVWQVYDIDVDITALSVGKDGTSWIGSGCPASGTVSITVDHEYKRGTGAWQENTWTFDVTFTNGAAAVDVANGVGLSAEYNTTVCTLPQ